MVKSGLIDRPWVNAYKLTLHFILAIISILFMVKTIADVFKYNYTNDLKATKVLFILISITFIQMIFAGLMSGMKAGLYVPSCPDMNGNFIPGVLLNSTNWTWMNLKTYESSIFAPALVQFVHRLLAYIILLLTGYVFFKYRNQVSKRAKFWLQTSFVLISIQLVLGILTILNVEAGIPLLYGVLHQLVGLLFFISLLFSYYSVRRKA